MDSNDKKQKKIVTKITDGPANAVQTCYMFYN
jgi:hypothetical protein